MNLSHYLEEKQNVVATNRLLKFVMIVLGVALVVNGFITYSLSKRARTIILPPSVGAAVEVSGDRLSDEYLRMMTRYVIGLVCTYNPASARRNFEEALGLADPDAYPQLKKELYELADTVEMAKVTNVFFIRRILVNDRERRIEIEGDKKQYANEQKIKDVPEAWILEYTNRNGRFAVARIVQGQAGRKDNR